ncbi:oligosaccharide flippase family protein [Rufibacter psychrotolerans]|uniref:oligosaccharide flippase family protein n=1 Tax=Rufibacter psychrotolerans TaxID=2812556 RepID=UPI00196737A5|nr:oligosaccharide flippase family protein [Rufibacter sp. SYSU D00308]
MDFLKSSLLKLNSFNLSERRIAKNFLSLGSVQLINFLIPILLTPYIIKKIGIEKFGVITVAQIVINYFIIFTDYGFNLTATRDISVHREDKAQLQAIFSTVFTTKAFLTMAGFVLLLAGLLWHGDPALLKLYLLTYTLVIGQALLPIWYFQGIENIKVLSYFNLLSKVVSVILILLVLKTEEDYLYINLIYGLGAILIGVIGILIASKRDALHFSLSTPGSVVHQLKEGWQIFLSNLTVNLYISSNIVILGYTGNEVAVGIYGVAEKVVNSIRQLLVIFYQVTYPALCGMATKSVEELKRFVKRLYLPFSLMILVACVGTFAFAGPIVFYFTDTYDPAIMDLLRILSVVPFIVSLNIWANQLLLAYGLKKLYSAVMVTGSVLNVGLNLLLSRHFLAYGTAVTVLVTEVFITAGIIVALLRAKPHLR